MVAKKPYLVKTLRLSLKRFVYVLIEKQMTDDSYHMPICIGIGIGIGISIGKIFSSVLGIESIGKSGIGPPLVFSLC